MRLRALALALLAVLTLGACTITYVVPDDGVVVRPVPASSVIERFDVFGGAEVFREGDDIEFVIRTSASGYVMLTSLLPSGEVRVVARNLPVEGGVTTVLDGSSLGSRFVVGAPSGWHRVRAAFTTGRSDGASAVFEGRFGEDDWAAAIRIVVDPFAISDIAETSFFVR